MRIVDPTGNEGIKLPGGIRVLFETFDWLLAAGTGIWIVSSYVGGLRPGGHIVGGVLIAIWVVITISNYRPA